jgi:hypothetical protein
MGLLGEIRQFVGKFIKNPITVAILAYLVYKLLSKNTKQESFLENMKVLYKKDEIEIVYDDVVKKFFIIDNRGGKNDYSYVGSFEDAKKKVAKISKEGFKEKINKLHKRVVG